MRACPLFVERDMKHYSKTLSRSAILVIFVFYWPLSLVQGVGPEKEPLSIHELEQQQTHLIAECRNTLKAVLQPVSLPVTALDLGQISVKGLRVSILLKKTQANIKSVYWFGSTLEDTLTFINLLESRKIKSMKVEAFEQPLDATFEVSLFNSADRYAQLQVIQDCQLEPMMKLMGKCSECRVLEWLIGKP